MPVQVFRILVPAEIRQHSTGAMFRKYFLRHFTNHAEHLKQQWAIRLFERNQRGDVTLRNDHDVHGPERARVVIREHVIRFADDFYRRAPAKYFITVEVFSHQASDFTDFLRITTSDS